MGGIYIVLDVELFWTNVPYNLTIPLLTSTLLEDFHEETITCLAGRSRRWSMGWRESELAITNDSYY